MNVLWTFVSRRMKFQSLVMLWVFLVAQPACDRRLRSCWLVDSRQLGTVYFSNAFITTIQPTRFQPTRFQPTPLLYLQLVFIIEHGKTFSILDVFPLRNSVSLTYFLYVILCGFLTNISVLITSITDWLTFYNIPKRFTCQQGTVCEQTEALCLLLRRICWFIHTVIYSQFSKRTEVTVRQTCLLILRL